MSNSGQIAADQRRGAALARGQCLCPRSPGKPATATISAATPPLTYRPIIRRAPASNASASRRVQDSFRFVAYKCMVVGIPAGGFTEGTIMVSHLRLRRASRAFRVALADVRSLLSVVKVFQAPAAARRA